MYLDVVDASLAAGLAGATLILSSICFAVDDCSDQSSKQQVKTKISARELSLPEPNAVDSLRNLCEPSQPPRLAQSVVAW